MIVGYYQLQALGHQCFEEYGVIMNDMNPYTGQHLKHTLQVIVPSSMKTMTFVIGRVDDVLNVAGHRIGTMEIESALVDHPSVAESAVIGIPDEIKGECIAAFVILKTNEKETDELSKNLKTHVSQLISPIAKPKHLIFTRLTKNTKWKNHATNIKTNHE